DTIAELAGKTKNPYQKQPMSGAVLQETIARYNSFVTAGADADFKKPKPLYKIEKPPFYAAWSTPILHDTLTGLRTNTNGEVTDIRGEVIQGLYCAGEAQGGFAQHGLARCLTFGRVAARRAAGRTAGERLRWFERGDGSSHPFDGDRIERARASRSSGRQRGRAQGQTHVRGRLRLAQPAAHDQGRRRQGRSGRSNQ